MDAKILDVNSVYHDMPLEDLMENAGIAVAKEARGYQHVTVIAGRGNNGGDALAAARILAEEGKKVRAAVIEGEKSRLCKLNLDRLPPEVETITVSKAKDLPDLEKTDLIIDGLMGTGFTGKLRESTASIIKAINASGTRILSIDAPSGKKVEADQVLSLHEAKVIGAQVADIGIPMEAWTQTGPGDVLYCLPKRKKDSHKGDHGRILVVGGSREYPGTPVLVGMACLRAGADLTTLAVPAYSADHMKHVPDLMLQTLSSQNHVTRESLETIDVDKIDVVVAGNGMGLHEESGEAVGEILSWKKPTVLDADALKLLNPQSLHEKTLITPHRREYETIYGEIRDDSLMEDIKSNAAKTRSTILLKGNPDIVSDGETTRTNHTGNPYMSVGGTGDVLAGVAAALYAKSGNPFLSACAAAFLTGFAGDLAAEAYTDSLTASDVTSYLPDAIRKCRWHGK